MGRPFREFRRKQRADVLPSDDGTATTRTYNRRQTVHRLGSLALSASPRPSPRRRGHRVVSIRLAKSAVDTKSSKPTPFVLCRERFAWRVPADCLAPECWPRMKTALQSLAKDRAPRDLCLAR